MGRVLHLQGRVRRRRPGRGERPGTRACVVRFFSRVAAVIMASVALFIPPPAAIIGNRSDDKD